MPTDYSASPPVPTSEFAERRDAVRRRAADEGLAGLVVFSRGGTAADFHGDVAYLANFHSPFATVPDAACWAARGHAALVLPVDGPCTLLTDYLDERDSRPLADRVVVDRRLPTAIGRQLEEAGLAGRRIGVVGRETLAWAWVVQMLDAAHGRLELEPADHILEAQRLIKSPAELDCMRHSARVGAEWMTRTLRALREGGTDADAVAEGLHYLVRHGGTPYDVAIASGPLSGSYWGRGGMPHWHHRRRLEDGDLVHVDAWGPVDGYYTDLARSTVIGRSPSHAQREVLEGSVALVEHVIAGVRPGVSFGELCRRGDEWLVDAGFADGAASTEPGAYGHSLYGHSLGISTERPWIVADEPTVLARDMVIAVEAIVGRDGVGSSNFEQTLIVGEDRVEILTSGCPDRWWD